MKIIDTNNLRGKKSLPDIEIIKIEEYIKKNNRERYEEIIQLKKTENEWTFTRLKVEEEIKLFASKQKEELKFMQLKSQEEQKMIEFKIEKEKLLREEENELKKAKAKEEMEKENLKMQREIELMEARTKNEMERENMKMQREKELMETRMNNEMEREKMKMQREKELREAKAQEEMERENMKMQADTGLLALFRNNYKEQSDKIKQAMELEKSKDLRLVLNEIFFGTPTNRLEKIEEILKEVEIYSGKDVLIADLNSLILQESLSSAEMLKFEEYLKKKNVGHYEKLMSDRELEKSKNLKYVLKQIFWNTSEERLKAIEKILKKEQIYLGSHMEIIDTNDLRIKKSLSDIEILKIEEHVKKHYNREGYDEIKSVKMADERKFIGLKVEDDIKFDALKQKEELKFMQLKAQEELKMIEFKTEKERLLREEEKELMKAKAEEEMEKEKMKVQIEMELMEAKIEMEKENKKLQREKLSEEARIKADEIKMQRERELREEKAKDLERLKLEFQREKESNEVKAKERMERETREKRIETLINEKKGLLDDVRNLEKERIRLKKVITENSRTGVKGYFINDSVAKKDAEDKYEDLKISLKSKNDKIIEINELLTNEAGF